MKIKNQLLKLKDNNVDLNKVWTCIMTKKNNN